MLNYLDKTETFYLFKVCPLCFTLVFSPPPQKKKICQAYTQKNAAKVHFSNQDATNALHCQLTPQTPLIAGRLHEPTIPGWSWPTTLPAQGGLSMWDFSFERCSIWDNVHIFEWKLSHSLNTQHLSYIGWGLKWCWHCLVVLRHKARIWENHKLKSSYHDGGDTVSGQT